MKAKRNRKNVRGKKFEISTWTLKNITQKAKRTSQEEKLREAKKYDRKEIRNFYKDVTEIKKISKQNFTLKNKERN